MNYSRGKLLEIKAEGKLLIITDLHGNMDDLKHYNKIWRGVLEENYEVVITGDVIHPVPGCVDNSLDVLEMVKSFDESYENFHLLLGNHEFSHISEVSVYKAGVNQTRDFEHKLSKRFQTEDDEWGRNKLQKYVEYFKTLPIAVKTDNKVFVSHAGPVKGIKSLDDIKEIDLYGYRYNQQLKGMLFNRPEDYNSRDLDLFLKNVGCNVSIVGHTTVRGYELVGNRQIIISSSNSLPSSKGDKMNAYVELDLEREIRDVKDVVGMVKFLN